MTFRPNEIKSLTGLSSLFSAISRVFMSSDIVHGPLLYNMRDGQYRYGEASKQFSDDITAMCTQLIERNQHPGLLISDREFTPFSLKTMIFCSQNGKNTAEFAALAGAKNFASFFFVPVRDRSNNSYLIAAASPSEEVVQKRNAAGPFILSRCYCAYGFGIFSRFSQAIAYRARDRECLVLSGRWPNRKNGCEKTVDQPFDGSLTPSKYPAKVGSQQ